MSAPMMMSQPVDLEAVRESYRPLEVSCLLVGESPPAGGTFFYLANSLLFRATYQTFSTQIPSLPNGEGFLRWLYSNEWFVTDLYRTPINHLSRAERHRHRQEGETALEILIARTRPSVVVSVLKGIEPNVRRALGASQHSARLVALPFPSYHHELAFKHGLAEVICSGKVPPSP